MTELDLRATAQLGDAIERLVRTLMAPIIIKPATLIGWHREGFRLFWRLKSQARGAPA